MVFWPFRRAPAEPLEPEELRRQLIAAAASGSPRRLRSWCRRHRDQVAAHVEFLCKIPEGLDSNPAALDRHAQCLGAAAQCLASECNAPELWQQLTGPDTENPLLQWDAWLRQVPERIVQLEYEPLIEEASQHIERAGQMRGEAARRYEAILQGHLGELLFQSGCVADARKPFESALAICRETGDIEGVRTYLNNLLEVHRYLGDTAAAVSTAEERLTVARETREPAENSARQVERLREGEPLCRIVCVHDGQEYELDEVGSVGQGRYVFEFRRNRLALQKATTLVDRANALASDGQLADALELYQQASEVDPYDPDPAYQSGNCLLELGAYGKAAESFNEVERLAPGWFHSRFDRWLAGQLDRGEVTAEEFQLLRAIQDGGLPADKAFPLARKAVEQFPGFAPFRLLLGNLEQNAGDGEAAIASYRAGLERCEEPDLESRLCCSLASALPADSPERRELVDRALQLEGNLVARAMARLMLLQ
ncbi:Tetratricopeptide repeat protein [Maioricimonas rarisocia]|uniref:Tetratricopeptide repeat protein n=1 Tax=Maioricimonas rarisocia TaxID=2528026 RepID=A0A517Z1E3_9PLAN|nr:tetratricopeptide repeat protein [Maioricimonas rarisocia]QDU36301.1 Tetratricopeptide repeat protein [Maioricimonas rarisocia]